MNAAKSLKRPGNKTIISIIKNYQLYLLLLPAVAYFAIFHYGPLYGIQLAFKDYIAAKGIWGSQWVGLKHFKMFTSTYYFWKLMKNTVGISLYSLAARFPTPILLALALNEVGNRRYRRIVQTVTYAPHFISQVVMVGIIALMLNPQRGPVNLIIQSLGFEPVAFMFKAQYAKSIYVWSGVWQNTGYASIIYFAVLSTVDPSLHEAAIIDGASRLQRIWYINIPILIPTATTLLILNTGQIMNVGFEKIYLMQNGLTQEALDVYSTYIYRAGLREGRFEMSTAVGLFNNIINFLLLVTVNSIARRVSSTSLW